jgi:hypothetical protein|tara:strand:+ start:45 stop:248 length:204 start_codon:yes stop_codon:yes gene_type:complete
MSYSQPNSPFLGPAKSGKGCADTDQGCIRASGDGTYYILNNKKGGIWRDGFASRDAAKKQIAAIHSN